MLCASAPASRCDCVLTALPGGSSTMEVRACHRIDIPSASHLRCEAFFLLLVVTAAAAARPHSCPASSRLSSPTASQTETRVVNCIVSIVVVHLVSAPAAHIFSARRAPALIAGDVVEFQASGRPAQSPVIGAQSVCAADRQRAFSHRQAPALREAARHDSCSRLRRQQSHAAVTTGTRAV